MPRLFESRGTDTIRTSRPLAFQRTRFYFGSASRVGLEPTPTCQPGRGGFPKRGCGHRQPNGERIKRLLRPTKEAFLYLLPKSLTGSLSARWLNGFQARDGRTALSGFAASLTETDATPTPVNIAVAEERYDQLTILSVLTPVSRTAEGACK
jgi:hypothetical protein